MEKVSLVPEHNAVLEPLILMPPAKSFASKKSIWWLKLIGINLLVFGLELCACAGFTYIPPILLKCGFSEKILAVILALGPLISLFLVPVIGRHSDKCQSRFGRRRPFMLALGLLMICSLIIIPFSYDIFSEQNQFFNPRFVLVAGVILLDFSSQALMNPCKSLIPDIFHSSAEQSLGFAAYSFMLSFGGCVGYFITSFDWTSTTLGVFFGGQEKAVFSLLAVALIFLLGINLSIANEEPYHRSIKLTSDLNCKHCNELKSVNTSSCHEHNSHSLLGCPPNGSSSRQNLYSHETRKGVFKFLRLKFLRFSKSLFQRLLLLLLLPISAIFKYIFKELFKMPKVVFRLFIACLLGWMGIVCHDMYYSDFVGQVIYKGEPHSEKQSAGIIRYDEGVRMGSWGLLFHSFAAAVYAAFQQYLIPRFGMRKVYIFGMLSFSLSMLGTILTSNLILVNSFAALSGLGLTAITTIPYSLMTEYSKRVELQFYFQNSCQGVGEEMALLDSTLYLAQIIPSLFLGFVVEYTKSSSTYMVVAALCGAAACCVAYFVSYTPQSINVH